MGVCTSEFIVPAVPLPSEGCVTSPLQFKHPLSSLAPNIVVKFMYIQTQLPMHKSILNHLMVLPMQKSVLNRLMALPMHKSILESATSRIWSRASSRASSARFSCRDPRQQSTKVEKIQNIRNFLSKTSN